MLKKMYFGWLVAVHTVALSIFTLSFVLSQTPKELYRTRNGIIEISAPFLDTVITARSNRLSIILNYETAKIDLVLHFHTLHTGIDSLDAMLKSDETGEINLTAQLGVEYINTQTHLPQHFNFEGTLLTPQKKELSISGEGHLEHLAGGEAIRCRLGMNFKLTLENLDYPYLSTPNNHDYQEAKITIIQSVLEKVN